MIIVYFYYIAILRLKVTIPSSKLHLAMANVWQSIFLPAHWILVLIVSAQMQVSTSLVCEREQRRVWESGCPNLHCSTMRQVPTSHVLA